MQTTTPALPHLAFYEALAALDESAPEWNPTVAGLLTLRLFDAWREYARVGEVVQAWQVSGVAEAVELVPEGNAARRSLAAVVAGARDRITPPAAVLPHLADYARALVFDARWLLAADVYTTILANAEGGAPELLVAAATRRGYCLRMAGKLDAAAASYDDARLLAAAYGSEAGVLEADVSHAALALHRGNLPAAEAQLDSVIERADPATCGQVLARALHERGHVAARRGRLDDAVVYGYRALALYEGAMERDRVLGDIAGALGAAGYHQAAWDGHLVLAATAQAQETRWAAIVNLIELAAWRGNERLFDRYRAELADVALPAWITGYYHLHSGDGFLRFGHRELAIASLERAVEVATQTQLNEVRMQAETLLSTIDRSPTPVFAAASPATPEIAEVIDALHRMHALAGIAAE